MKPHDFHCVFILGCECSFEFVGDLGMKGKYRIWVMRL